MKFLGLFIMFAAFILILFGAANFWPKTKKQSGLVYYLYWIFMFNIACLAMYIIHQIFDLPDF